jgi:hypothetical protein
MSEFVLTGRLSELAAPFSPERFSPTPSLDAAAQ